MKDNSSRYKEGKEKATLLLTGKVNLSIQVFPQSIAEHIMFCILESFFKVGKNTWYTLIGGGPWMFC